MKLFITTIAAIALASTAYAQAPKAPPDKCELRGVMASLAMALRQDGIPIAESRLLGHAAKKMTPEEVKSYDDILAQAYARPVLDTAPGREAATTDFEKEIALRCRETG